MKIVLGMVAGIAVGAIGMGLAGAGGTSEEVRVGVRAAAGGLVEVGVSQRLEDGSWGEVAVPAGAVLDGCSGEWRFSGGAEIVHGPGAPASILVRVTPESITASAEPSVETRCRFASVTRRPGSETVWLHALEAGECAEWAAPVRMLSVRDGTVEVEPDDPQAGRVGDWLHQLRERSAAQWGCCGGMVSLAAFERALALAYSDFLGGRRTPPRVRHDPSSNIRLHNYQENEIVMPRSELSAFDVLDSIAYQLTGRLNNDDWRLGYEWSGPELAAQAIAVFDRYLPGFDAEAARASAAEFGVRAAAEPPAPAVQRGDGFAVQLQRLLGIPRDAALPLPAAEVSERAVFSVSAEEGRLTVRSALGAAVSECGNLSVVRGNRAVWVRPWGSRECADTEALIPVGFAQGAEVEVDREDPQQYRVYDWERQVEANVLPAEMDAVISLERAQAIADAVFADVFGPSRRPPRVRLVDGASSSYSHQFRQIRLNEAGMNGATVLHEAVHAVLAVEEDRSFRRWEGHGREYAATILTLWERYVPGFDGARARGDAEVHGVEVAARSPSAPVGGAAEARAVTEALGLEYAAAGDCTHAVAAGETLVSIAALYGLTPAVLLSLNPRLDSPEPAVGLELAVPCR